VKKGTQQNKNTPETKKGTGFHVNVLGVKVFQGSFG